MGGWRGGTDSLYVGDIGDTKGTRDGSNTTGKSRVRLYRFPEPVVSASGPKVTGTITQFNTFVYRYADANGTLIAPPEFRVAHGRSDHPRRLRRREEGADVSADISPSGDIALKGARSPTSGRAPLPLSRRR
jgi:hypothetical protein